MLPLGLAVDPELTDSLVAASPAMLEAVRQLALYAVAHTPLVLVGATGTGKTFLARLAHEWSGRRGSFRAVTAGELRGSLYHDLLFGHEAGAFTGARGRRGGILAAAAGGTLLLDDFHHLPPGRQTALLRVLEDGFYTPLGSDRDVQVQCRVILGLCDEPDRLSHRGRMLREVRSRLGYCVVRLPDLTERREEIPLLVQRFVALCPGDTGRPGPGRASGEVVARLREAEWTGNLRDLRKAIQAAYLRAAGAEEIGVEHLPVEVAPLRYRRDDDVSAKRRVVEEALRRTGGRTTAAAKLLGVHRNTILGLRRQEREAPLSRCRAQSD